MKPPEVIVLVYLIYASLVDIRTREIDPVVTAVTALAGVVFVILVRRSDPAGVALSLLPGLGLVLFGLVSRGRFGAGDGLTILTAGLFLGAEAVMVTVMGGLLLSSCYAAALMIAGRRKPGARPEKASFPFLPFLLGGFVLCLILSAF